MEIPLKFAKGKIKLPYQTMSTASLRLAKSEMTVGRKVA
jgi:hypothetical protein